MSKLYLISPPDFTLESFKKDLNEALSGGDIFAFQLRVKNKSDDEIQEISSALLPICHTYGTPFILNDYHHLARKIGVDGVHLGGADGNIQKIRSVLGKNIFIGASCYNSKQLAQDAVIAGADYVSFGSLYPSPTKPLTKHMDLNKLKSWCDHTRIPTCAIGGINLTNIGSVIATNVDFICVISAVWNSEFSPKKAVQELQNKIKKGALQAPL